MARLGKVYTGPEVPLLRRLVLRHARAKWVLVLAAACIALVTIWAGWSPPAIVITTVLGLLVIKGSAFIWAARERDKLVREAPLPRFLRQKLLATYPHLTVRDAELVERGLRQYFIACQRSHGRFVAMPSQVVDSMWHEFILHTTAYREWCDLVIGRFIDHVPAEVLGRKAPVNDGLRRAWFWACRDESIDPRNPSRLPLLFALDNKFAIPGGFAYVADCRGVRRDGSAAAGSSTAHCGESFSDGSYSGDADSFGGSDTSSSDSSSDGSSSSDSSGCGSGCGGGGD